MKIFILLSISIIYVNAGFWSSALGTAVGNSINSPTKAQANTVKYYKEKDATKEPKKIQQVLSKLGFYNGNFDGNINSFDTRDSIEQFQAYYSLQETGTLNELEKADLLYMHDLIKNYKKELKKPGDKDSKRLLKIYKAFDKLEIKLSKNNLNNNLLTSKFKKEIIERRKFLIIKNEKYTKWKNNRLKNMSVFKDPFTRKVWQNEKIKEVSWHQAKKICNNLILAGSSNWRLAKFEELKTLYLNNGNINFKSTKFYGDNKKEIIWTPDYHNYYNHKGTLFLRYLYNDKTRKAWQPKKEKYYYRCVKNV